MSKNKFLTVKYSGDNIINIALSCSRTNETNLTAPITGGITVPQYRKNPSQ